MATCRLQLRMADRPPRAPRSDSPEALELQKLKAEQPALAPAVDMQLALLDMQRRVQSRVPLPWIQADPAWVRAQYAAGRPVVRFGDIPIDWTDFRLTLRQTADILRRFDALDRADYDQIVAFGREHDLEPQVARWYEQTSGRSSETSEERPGAPAGMDQVLALALRPFLARCAEVLMPRAESPATPSGRCPFCGWEPEFSVITPSADRRLVCGRCLGQWVFDPLACPFCGNNDRTRITSFATRDGRYRVYGCDMCHRYLKAYDGRGASRPMMLGVDTIATLPLDAAALQRGYVA